MKKLQTSALPMAKESVIFRILFNPLNEDNGGKIKFPNGETVTSEQIEVKKHLTRAVIKACLDNKMKKKATLLRSFMKDDGTLSLLDKKMDDLRKHFLDAASSASIRNKEQCGTRLLATKESLGLILQMRIAMLRSNFLTEKLLPHVIKK